MWRAVTFRDFIIAEMANRGKEKQVPIDKFDIEYLKQFPMSRPSWTSALVYRYKPEVLGMKDGIHGFSIRYKGNDRENLGEIHEGGEVKDAKIDVGQLWNKIYQLGYDPMKMDFTARQGGGEDRPRNAERIVTKIMNYVSGSSKELPGISPERWRELGVEQQEKPDKEKLGVGSLSFKTQSRAVMYLNKDDVDFVMFFKTNKQYDEYKTRMFQWRFSDGTDPYKNKFLPNWMKMKETEDPSAVGINVPITKTKVILGLPMRPHNQKARLQKLAIDIGGNADFFTNPMTRDRADKLIKAVEEHFIKRKLTFDKDGNTNIWYMPNANKRNIKSDANRIEDFRKMQDEHLKNPETVPSPNKYDPKWEKQRNREKPWDALVLDDAYIAVDKAIGWVTGKLPMRDLAANLRQGQGDKRSKLQSARRDIGVESESGKFWELVQDVYTHILLNLSGFDEYSQESFRVREGYNFAIQLIRDDLKVQQQTLATGSQSADVSAPMDFVGAFDDAPDLDDPYEMPDFDDGTYGGKAF